MAPTMLRTIITADKNNLTLSLPDNFLGKEVEIIVFIIDETKAQAASLKNSKTFSAIKLDTSGFKFNRDEANDR